MNISSTDAAKLFTKKLVARYADALKPMAFGRSFFTEVESDTKEISIQVERDAELIAVDVMRGTEGNRNVFDKSTEKIFVPPYYNEYFDMTQLQLYDALYVSPEISVINFSKFLDSAAAKQEAIMDKIDRAYELQSWQVMQTGVVTLNKGVNIDFKRKGASIVTLTGAYWDGALVDPNTSIEVGCKFLRETGKMAGSTVNMILSSTAMAAYLSNAAVQKRGVIYNYSMDMLVPAQRNALGQSFHGEVSVGSYRVRLWTYPEIYETRNASTGAITKHKYLTDGNVILLPELTKMVMSYAAVPQLLTTGIAPKKGKFLAYDFIDERATSHLLGVKSAGVAIPVAVDQIYTMKVLA